MNEFQIEYLQKQIDATATTAKVAGPAKGRLRAQVNYQIPPYVRRQLYDACVPLYSAPNRQYHDRLHLDSMLATYDEVYGHSPSDAMFLAMLFHDAIWVCNQSPNVERLSADLIAPSYFQITGRNLPRGTQECAAMLIRQTIIANHMSDRTLSANMHPEMLRILDMDLCAMRSNWEHFVEIQHRVMAETAHMQTRAQLVKGCLKFFDAIIDRGFVYYTPEMTKFNHIAMNNILAFSHLLSKGIYKKEQQLTYRPDSLAAIYLIKRGLRYDLMLRLIPNTKAAPIPKAS